MGFYVAYAGYVLLDATEHDALRPYSVVLFGFVVPITAVWLVALMAGELRQRRVRQL